jgi:glycosyltransferase involved in cell wall biosynthesis
LITTGFPPDNGGGIGTYIYNLAKGLVKLGHTIHVISPTSGPDYIQDNVDGINVHRLPKKVLPKIERLLPGFRWSYQVYKLIKQLHRKQLIDVIEFPNWEASGVLSQLMLNIPTVVRVHTPFFETLGLDSDNITFGDKAVCKLEEWSCKNADKLVSSTRCHAKTISDKYLIPLEEFTILPLGIIDKASNKTYKNAVKDEIKLLYVSRLENRKGTLALIQALPLLKQKTHNFHIDIIGSDRPHAPGGIKFQQYFKQNYDELSNKVSFHGFVDDEELDRFYRQADLFVVPSVYESFGLIYVEAMMYGLPSIATTGGGIGEVITDGKDGFLTKINHSDEIVTRIVEFMNDRELLNTMSLVARTSFEAKFEYLIMSRNTEAVYEKTRKK